MIVVYICVFFYSFFKTFHRRNQNPESRSLSLRRKRSFCSTQKGRFPPPFRFTFIHENHPSDIIIKMFSISATTVVVSASSANKVRFCFCRSLSVFLFFAFFAFKRFAREGLWWWCFSLSRARIDFSHQNPRWQKYGSSSRNLSHTPFTSPFSRASLRDRDSGGFLLFSFILSSRRNKAECDDILPPSREEEARDKSLGFYTNTHFFSLSLSLRRTQKQNTAKKVVSKNNNNTVAKNAALLAATIATISSSGAALADDIEDVYAATYAKGRDGFGVRSPQRAAVDVNLQRKQAAPKPKFVKPVREEAPKPAKKESSGGGFSLPSISLPSISLPSFGGDAPATADE